MSLKSTLVGGIAVLGMMAVPLASAIAAEPPVDSKMPQMEKNAIENAERVDGQIKALHDKLNITSEQEVKWKDVAEAMRKTAKEVRDKLTERAEKDKTAAITAVDELKYYEALQEVQYDGAKRLVDPFEDLYKAMSADQKKNADALFAQPHETSSVAGGSAHHHMSKTD